MASNYMTVANAAAELGVTEEQISSLGTEGKLRIVQSKNEPLVNALDVALLADPRFARAGR